MTIMEVIFALFMFATSCVASSFAFTSTILEYRTLEQMQAIDDAAQTVVALWFGQRPLPSQWRENGVTCVISVNTVEDGKFHETCIQITAGRSSQLLWLENM